MTQTTAVGRAIPSPAHMETINIPTLPAPADTAARHAAARTTPDGWARRLFPWGSGEVSLCPAELGILIVLDHGADDRGVWVGTMTELIARSHQRRPTALAALEALSWPLPAVDGMPRRPAMLMRIPGPRGLTSFALADWEYPDADDDTPAGGDPSCHG